MPRWLRTLLRLTPVVAVVSAISVAGLLVFRAFAPIDVLHAAANELGNYLQTVGGIYAVLLAFVVYVVWGQFNDARGYLDREATALRAACRRARAQRSRADCATTSTPCCATSGRRWPTATRRRSTGSASASS